MRTPTFVNLWYTTETHNASGVLQPEYSQSFELSARYHSSVLQAYISGFKTEGRDLIDWVKQSPTDTKWSSWNHSRIDNYGIEAGVSLRYGHFLPFLGTESKLQLDYLHIHQEHLSYRIGRHLEGSWDLRYQDRVGQSSPFATLDGKLDYLISEHLRVGIQANNITDTRYSDIVGVVQPGFWLSAGISCKL